MNFKFNAEHTFFTSDTHFNHANIIRFCNRPFKDVTQMNETLIANWNSVIDKDDTVFHLGDFCLGGAAEWTQVLNRLNGKIYLIMGNHDLKNIRQGFWQLFGHVHTRKNNTGNDAGRLQYLYPTQYDVGVDNNGFAPVSFEQVKRLINKQFEQTRVV